MGSEAGDLCREADKAPAFVCVRTHTQTHAHCSILSFLVLGSITVWTRREETSPTKVSEEVRTQADGGEKGSWPGLRLVDHEDPEPSQMFTISLSGRLEDRAGGWLQAKQGALW